MLPPFFAHVRALLLIAIMLILALPGSSPAAAPSLTEGETVIHLPLVSIAEPRTHLGYDLRINFGAQAEPLLAEIPATWARAGDLFWSEVEPVRGAYSWEAAAELERNIRRLRAANIEPVVVVQMAPEWARSLPGRTCSPVAAAAYDDLARFAAAAAARYSSGDLTVRYWQFWNEPDFTPAIGDHLGSGCWNSGQAPWYGGDGYGAALRVFAGAVRSASPAARIIGGNFAHFWPDDRQTLGFLHGMIEQGGLACDMIGFSGYTRWGTAERMALKAQNLRRALAAYGLQETPLVAVEVGEVCPEGQPCPKDYQYLQANYAARIYALAIALDLRGIMWFTLMTDGPGFQQSHLVDVAATGPAPRPAFYAYRNAARLLRDASYAGPPLTNVRFDEDGVVQVLRFVTRDGRPLYVVWLPNATAEREYALVAWPGARATCTTGLERPTPLARDCSDTRGDGLIRFKVSDAPVYVQPGA